jgi:hypothetical protein
MATTHPPASPRLLPDRPNLLAAAALIEPHVDSLRPWEVSVLLWGAARLGYEPRPALLRAFRARVAATLRQPPGTLRAFSPQEACMAAWALSVVGGQDAELWALEVAFAAACPPDAMDEASGAGPGQQGGVQREEPQRKARQGMSVRSPCSLHTAGLCNPVELLPPLACPNPQCRWP